MGGASAIVEQRANFMAKRRELPFVGVACMRVQH